MKRGCDEKALCSPFSVEGGVVWSLPGPPRRAGSAEAARLASAWALAGPARTGQRSLPFPAPGFARRRAEPRSQEASFPSDLEVPASDATSSSPGVMLRAVWTCKWFQDRRPGPRGGEGPSKTGKRHRENTQVGAWAWEEQGAVVRGMTQGPGHVVWGQLPRELTKPGPGEVKQGLDARSRGSRRWGPCTKGPVGTRQHAGLV